MGTYLMVAVRNLVQGGRRTILLGLALAIVAMLLVLLMSLSQGLRDTMVRSATLLSSGHVNVAGFYKAKLDDAFPLVSNRAALRKLVAEQVPGVHKIIDRGRGWAKLISESASLQTGLNGIDVTEEADLLANLQLAQESEYKEGGRSEVVGDLNRLADPNTALIFAGQAKRLRVGVGDTITVTAESFGGATNTGEVTVVAVARDIGFMSNWSVFVPKQVLQELYRLDPDVTGAIMLYLDDIATTPAVLARLREVLSAAGYQLMDPDARAFWMKFETVAAEDWTGQKLDLTTWEDETSYMKWMLGALDTISFFLTAVLLCIIVVGIMNAMWIAVRERTREIGTLRAIGMPRSRVLVMFMLEAFMLGVAGTTLGTLLGAAVATLINAAHIRVGLAAMRAILMSDVLHLSLRGGQLLGPVIAFTIVSMLAALWPALRAARLRPITAIHHIG